MFLFLDRMFYFLIRLHFLFIYLFFFHLFAKNIDKIICYVTSIVTSTEAGSYSSNFDVRFD